MTDINSKAYWDGRYGGHWDACDGPAQSRFFSNLALRILPEWLLGEIRRSHLTIADWGCGEGDGTDVWAAYAPVEQITGIDFSEVAIGTARDRYPKVRFLAEDWLTDCAGDQQFDIVFSSNVIEHFHDPQKVLNVLCNRARKAIFLALPYREVSRISEHFFTFTPNNIPINLGKRFRLVFSKVIDCKAIPDNYWPGEQIILLYIDTDWGDTLQLTLSDSSTEGDSNDAEIASLKSMIAESNVRSSEKENRYLEEIRFALSNLSDLHRDHVSAASEHAQRLDTLAHREREFTEKYIAQMLALQAELSKAQGELRSAEQRWFGKLRAQDGLYAAKHNALQQKLIHTQQLASSLAKEKTEQAETFERQVADLRVLMEGQQREQMQAHAEEIELIRLSAEKHKTEQYEQAQAYAQEVELIQMSAEKRCADQSAAFTRQLQQFESAYAAREHELSERLTSVQDEAKQTNDEWQKLLDKQLDAHERQASELRGRIDELEKVNFRQQEEARERQGAFEARESHAIEMYGTREAKLNEMIVQKDENLHALISYVGMLEQWRYVVEASLAFRLLSCFSRRTRQALPKLHPVEVALLQSTSGTLAESSSGMDYQGVNNYLNMLDIEGMKVHDAVMGNNNVKTVDDLLALQGTQFIDAAYRAILDREPDHAGRSYYFRRLQLGVGKVEILSQISASEEGRSSGRVLPRLNETIRRAKWSRVPLLGWLAPRTERTHYKVRAIEHSLSEIGQATTRYMPRLEREIAAKSRDIESNAGLIAELQQQLAARDAELAGTRQMLTETTGQLEQLTRATDLSWEQFQVQILARRNEYKGVFIQELVIDWNVPLYQRPQHIATAFGRLGYLVIFRTDNWGGDNVSGFRQVERNVWITNRQEASSIDNAVYSFYSTAYANTPERIEAAARRGVVVYEYIDHIDPMISGSAENIQRLVALKDYAFSGGAQFVVASAKKLHEEAVGDVGVDRVILAQNGVDTDHYRNPAHQMTVLPESLTQFRKKYKKVVGYFGAIAPWLWYEAIEDLTKARPDLGFIFIGPDYYGGVDKLATRDNVLYLGAIDYKILPAYARQFDICFIPFSPGEIAKTTSPLKLFEYFALEKPVVATSDMAECVAFPEVFAGNSAKGLSTAIDNAFRVKDDKAFKARLSQLADQNAWIERARAMEKAFEISGAKQ